MDGDKGTTDCDEDAAERTSCRPTEHRFNSIYIERDQKNLLFCQNFGETRSLQL